MIQLSLFEEIDTIQFINYCLDMKIMTNYGFRKYITGDIEEINWEGVCKYSIIRGARVILDNRQITIQRKGKKDIIVTEAEIIDRVHHLKREYLEEVL